MPSRSSPPKLSLPYSAVATLLLIENSPSMLAAWRILRDQYLPSVLRKLQGSNSTALPPSTFFIESSSLSPAFGVPAQCKVYHGSSCELELKHDAASKISPEKIHSSIDLLTSVTPQNQPVGLNLIVMAASAPIADYQNIDPNYRVAHSQWLQLAKRLAQENIQCHLILKPHQDTSPFEIMFEETLRMKKFCEAPLPFDLQPTEAIIRLMEVTADRGIPGAVIQTGICGRRSPLRRTRTQSLEAFNGRTNEQHYSTPSQGQAEVPSLVAQLQQRHGLTKKKVYGIKPPRAPFFRDEPPSDPYRRPGLPLSTPLTDMALATPVTLTPGGRSAPLSKLDRMSRIAHRSPTDTSSRRWHSNSSGSPCTDTGCPAPAPPTYIPLSETSTSPSYQQLPIPPITPIQPSVETQCQPAALDEAGFYKRAAYEPCADPQWGNTANVYIIQNYDNPPLTSTHQDDYHPIIDFYDPPRTADSPPLSRTPPTSSIDSQSSGAAIVTSCERTPIKHGASRRSSFPTSSPSKATSNPKDDEPFTFGPEYIAATAVMFRQEVLPAYPEYAELAGSYGPPLTKRGNAIAARGNSLGCDHAVLPYLPASKAGQLFTAKYGVAAACQQSTAEAGELPIVTSEYTSSVTSTSCLPQYPTYSVGTSSLTGWAG